MCFRSGTNIEELIEIDEKSTKQWVSDKLVSILRKGNNPTTIAQYVIGLAEESSSAEEILNRILEFDRSCPITETRLFSVELFRRITGKRVMSTGRSSDYPGFQKDLEESGNGRRRYRKRNREEDEVKDVHRFKKASRRKSVIQDSREVSRARYLKERLKKKLEELKEEIEEDEYLLSGTRRLYYRERVYEVINSIPGEDDVPKAYDNDGVVNRNKRFEDRDKEPGGVDTGGKMTREEVANYRSAKYREFKGLIGSRRGDRIKRF